MVGFGDGGGRVGYVELFVDVGGVDRDRFGADSKPLGHGEGGHSVQEELDDFGLASTEIVEVRKIADPGFGFG